MLVDALAEADLPYDFDVDGNLVVLADDEARVEELLDTVEFPDALDADTKGGGDGLVAQEVLSDLFVAADRLRHHARDPEGVLGFGGGRDLGRGSGAAVRLRAGCLAEDPGWRRVLRASLEGDDVGDEDIEAQADEYRTLLREYV